MYFSQSVSRYTSTPSFSLCAHFKQVQSFPSWFCSMNNNLSTFCSAHKSLHFSLFFPQASRVAFPQFLLSDSLFFLKQGLTENISSTTNISSVSLKTHSIFFWRSLGKEETCLLFVIHFTSSCCSACSSEVSHMLFSTSTWQSPLLSSVFQA